LVNQWTKKEIFFAIAGVIVLAVGLGSKSRRYE
jgi:hypothetical protein